MQRRKRKKRLFLRGILYVFIVSLLSLFALSIIFYPSWFGKKTIIVPVVNASIGELEISKLLSDNNIEFVSVDIASDYADVSLKDGSSVYISLKKDIVIQISSLQAVLKQLTINGKRFSLIDFRFDKPVIRYAN